MKYLILTTLFTVALTGLTHAQNAAPIFVSPYNQNDQTFNSNIPTIIRPKEKQAAPRFAKPRTNVNKWEPYNMANPLEGTSFGRITREIDYYDVETEQYYNQYDYMSLLAQRGDLAKLQEVATYLQTTGVFDPQKYQAAMQAARNGTTLSSQMMQQGANTPMAGGPQAPQKQLFIVKPQNQINTPQKIHRDYDDAQANNPIFIQ